jgi:hypothetical protein
VKNQFEPPSTALAMPTHLGHKRAISTGGVFVLRQANGKITPPTRDCAGCARTGPSKKISDTTGTGIGSGPRSGIPKQTALISPASITNRFPVGIGGRRKKPSLGKRGGGNLERTYLRCPRQLGQR